MPLTPSSRQVLLLIHAIFAFRRRCTVEEQIERQLALEFVRVTEAAALASGRLMGTGEKGAVMPPRSGQCAGYSTMVEIDGTIVIGEGEMDEAPMLYIGESWNGQRTYCGCRGGSVGRY